MVERSPTFRAGKPKTLFEGRYQTGYDVAPDGSRFLMSGVSSNVQAGIGVYPLASAQTAAGLFPNSLSAEERTTAMRAASPTTYIGKNFAPTIFIHGTGDTTVPMSSSIDFFNKLHDAGVPAALTLIQGAAHAFDNSALDAVEVMARSIDVFLDRLIVKPQPYPSFGGGGGRGAGRGGRAGQKD